MLNRLSIMSSQKTRHAFFSETQKQAARKAKLGKIWKDNKEVYYSSNIYLTTDGREVEATEVRADADSYNKKTFPDFVYLGQVTKWVRVVKDD